CFFDLLESVAPKLLRTTKVVKRAAEDERIVAIDGEALIVVANAIWMREDARTQRRCRGMRGRRVLCKGDQDRDDGSEYQCHREKLLPRRRRDCTNFS